MHSVLGSSTPDLGHKVEYWTGSPDAAPMEIFAELFTMETQNDSDLYIIKKIFPDLWKEYQKLF